uniref:Uncharacterized protein n=1 Tax=Timema shepardi TaxID=629360 RepID=A0A7R9AXE9_TIMSH|nr:unnamed protein product [Timema shepardi]
MASLVLTDSSQLTSDSNLFASVRGGRGLGALAVKGRGVSGVDAERRRPFSECKRERERPIRKASVGNNQRNASWDAAWETEHSRLVSNDRLVKMDGGELGLLCPGADGTLLSSSPGVNPTMIDLTALQDFKCYSAATKFFNDASVGVGVVKHEPGATPTPGAQGAAPHHHHHHMLHTAYHGYHGYDPSITALHHTAMSHS